MTTYNNPRMASVIENWPSGSKRVTAQFLIERDPKRGERAIRITTGAPKKLTYAHKMRIVDGDDGKTYIAELSMYGHVSIMQGNMQFQQETFFPDNPRFAEVTALFN